MKTKNLIYLFCLTLVLGLTTSCGSSSGGGTLPPDPPTPNPPVETYTDAELEKVACEYMLSADFVETDEVSVLLWLQGSYPKIAADATLVTKVVTKVANRPAGTSGSRTVLVYQAAQNSLGKFSSSDVDEMLKGFADGAINAQRHNLLVFIDDADGNPEIYQIMKDSDGKVTKQKIYVFGQDYNSASPATLKEVMKKVTRCYPAETYGFVYWSHGEAWVPYPVATKSLTPMADVEYRWIGQDTGFNNTRTQIVELAEVFKSLNIYLDFLMFDACYMLSAEVAYDLKDVTDYIVSSPTEIPGPGAPYDIIIPKMFGSNAAVNIPKSYVDYYRATYDETRVNLNTWWTGGASVGVIKASEMEHLAQATKEAVETVDDDYFLPALKTGQMDYDLRSSSSSYIGYFDMVSVMERLLSEESFNTWRIAYDAAVPVFDTTPMNFTAFNQSLFSMEKAHGMSMYIPRRKNSTIGIDVAFRETGWYQAAGLEALEW